MERERQLWTSFLRRALDSAGRAGLEPEAEPEAAVAPEQQPAAEQQQPPPPEQPAPEQPKKDLEGDLRGVIRATERP